MQTLVKTPAPRGARLRVARAMRCVAVVCLGAMVACAAPTQFVTDPPGAKLYINGAYVGETPFYRQSTTGFPHRYHVQLFKDGYEPLDLLLDSSMSWVSGYFAYLFPPLLLWSYALADGYTFKMTPRSVASTPAP